MLSNAVGVIDSGYRGEVSFKFKPCDVVSGNLTEYEVGDRIGQIVIIPHPNIELVEVSELSETERGISGYGSTGI